MIFFELASSAFTAVLYGIVLTVFIVGLLYVILRQISRGIVESVGFYITGAVLTLMLIVQFTMMFGAIKAKGYVDMVEDNVSELIAGVNGAVTADESKEIIDELASENSLVGLFIDKVNVEGQEIAELPHVVANAYRDRINSWIWNRFWWILGSLVTAITIMILTRNRTSSYDLSDGMTGDLLDGYSNDLLEDSLDDTDIY